MPTEPTSKSQFRRLTMQREGRTPSADEVSDFTATMLTDTTRARAEVNIRDYRTGYEAGQREGAATQRAEDITILERLQYEHASGDVYGVQPILKALAALKAQQEPSP